MKTYNELNEWEKTGVEDFLKKRGFSICTYHPENEKGMSINGVGFMLKDLIIDGS